MKIVIGKITKPIGLKGEVKVFSESDFLSRRFSKNNQLFLENKGKIELVHVEKASISNRVVRLKLKEYNSIEEVISLRDSLLLIESEDDDSLDIDEFYFYDLKQCDVFENNQKIGFVKDVLEYPSSTILVVMNGEKKILIPFLKVFVTNVDIKNKKIDVSLIEGF